MNSTTRLRPAANLLSLALLGACAAGPVAQKYCESGTIGIDAHFDGGNFHTCSIDEAGNALVRIRPENEPINPSPWYALRVSARRSTQVSLTLDFGDNAARYRPKVSRDGRHWQALDDARVALSADERRMTLTLAVDAPVLWVAAQELLGPGWYDAWLLELAARGEVDVALLGYSVRGRPLYVATTPDAPATVVLLGRQHPPEVSGALAMRRFIDTLLADSDAAREFRRRFRLVVVPLVNPDGVALGHWRHNANGVDLNRDWGPFTQPETRHIAGFVAALASAGRPPVLMLDFHSTSSSLFYTQLAEDFFGTADFATTWLDRARQRLPGYDFRHAARPRSDQANTKNWFFGHYGIPAITFELGDETPRSDIAASSVVFAEEMMQLLLERTATY